MSAQPKSADHGAVIRRSLFFLALLVLTAGSLLTVFRGLNTPQAMDQAQIGREIARGNGFSTKFIRPVAVHQVAKAEGTVSFKNFPDTYHAPLNPLIYAAVLKLVGGDSADDWKIPSKQVIYPLDRIIAAVSTFFFLLSIGMSYLLISRIFDAKIAGVCAVLMLFCESFWGYALSGLPQMLMLFLFSCGAYFAYRAVEASSEGRVPFTPAIIAGVFFVLMALAHWLCIWIVLGYIVFAAVAFRPRGIIGISVLAILFAAALFPMIVNSRHTDSPFGTSLLMVYRGLGDIANEEAIMRTDDIGSKPLILKGVVSRVFRATILQTTDIIPFLGGILVAPIFFIALLHPFKRQPIARFRWALLLMWCFATFGMAVFGISSHSLDPNQIHLLFAPIMAAYGLAFLSIIWSRLDIVAANPVLRNVHYIIIVFLCATPLALSLPRQVSRGLEARQAGGVPAWPPYYASALNVGLKNIVEPNQLCFSDQPWAVAWYADRTSIWLPTSKRGFEKLKGLAAESGMPCAGIMISPSSHGSGDIISVYRQYGELTSLVIDGPILGVTQSPTAAIYERDSKIESIAKEFPYRTPLMGGYQTVFYGERRTRNSDNN